jgi:AcrR family transcriptional regulator
MKKRGAALHSPPAQAAASPRRIPQQDRSRARVDAILSAARKLIGKGGEPCMREIAAAAGVPIASVYQYFPDRNAVLRALTIQFYERMRARLETALLSLERIDAVPAFVDAMIDGLVVELGAARPHLNVWAAAQASDVLRELDARDAIELVDLVHGRLRSIAPDTDPDRLRDIVVFAVIMAGPVVRQSFVLPPPDGERLLRELKALIRLRLSDLV